MQIERRYDALRTGLVTLVCKGRNTDSEQHGLNEPGENLLGHVWAANATYLRYGESGDYAANVCTVTLLMESCGCRCTLRRERKKACVEGMHRLECGVQNARMGGRVVECSGLENRRRETFRGFESHPIRGKMFKNSVLFRRVRDTVENRGKSQT